MFVKAIEIASQFTRPIHSIERLYGSTEVLPGAASLFFVNADGWALTCKHVADRIVGSNELQKRKQSFDADFAAQKGKKKDKHIHKELEHKYKLDHQTVFEIRNVFVNCVEGNLDLQLTVHQNLDIALLHFRNFAKLQCSTFPVFPKDTTPLKQGKFLGRLGFPFPEFTNFVYNSVTNTIEWTKTGKDHTPIFPIEGMLTRHLADQNGQIIGFEMSTPGLRGQSGGPVFDFEGKVWGMQSATNHLDLDFDVNKDVIRGGQKKTVKDSAFLHVGHCVHVEMLKSFMREHKVDFQEK